MASEWDQFPAAPVAAQASGWDQFPATAPAPATAQIGGPWRYPALIGSNLAKGVAQGVGMVGDAQSLIQKGVNYPADALASYILGKQVTPTDRLARPPTLSGAAPPESSETRGLLSSGNLVGAGKSLGIMDRPDLQPQNAAERYTAAGSAGVGGMLPLGLLGSGGAVANAVRGVVQGAGAGLGGEAGAEMLPNYPTAGRLAGTLAGAGAGGSLFNVGNRLAGAASGAGSPTIEAYRQLGITPSLIGDVSGGTGARQLQAFAGKAPGGAGRMRDASEKAVDQWGRALDVTADNYGASSTLQQAGEAAQKDAQRWLADFNTQSRNAWNQVEMHVPSTTTVPVTNYATTLNAVRTQMPNAPATAEVLQPSLSKNLLDSLTKDLGQGPLTFKDVKGIRTRIGEKLAEPQLVGDTSYGDLKRLYGALSDDMGAVVAQQGPRAQQAFADASALTKNGHNFIEDVLSKVVRGTDIAPERAASNLLSTAGTGGTTLNAVRAQMPQAADELAAFKLRDMALANPGQQSGAGTRLSPGTFVTDANKLSPEGSRALFGNNSRIDALKTVGDTMKQTERFANQSNTGQYLAMDKIVNGILGTAMAGGALGGAYGGGLKGMALGAGAGALPLVTGNTAARVASSPMMAGLLAARPASAPAAALQNRAAVLPPLLRALLAGTVH